jgi:hypothetical protein
LTIEEIDKKISHFQDYWWGQSYVAALLHMKKQQQQVVQPNNNQGESMYRLFINNNGQRLYVVNETRSGDTYSFQLTAEQSAARKFKGGGRFSASPVAALFGKEEVKNLVWDVTSNGTIEATYNSEEEARQALAYWSKYRSCLAVSSRWA